MPGSTVHNTVCTVVIRLTGNTYEYGEYVCTGNGERKTGNGERETGHGKRGTGNGERKTGNGERETGNGEEKYCLGIHMNTGSTYARGTGNGERETGNGEWKTGNGNGERERGRASGNKVKRGVSERDEG